MHLVVDANILVAALLKDATTRDILFKEDIEFFAPEYLLTEAERLLKNPRIRRRFPLGDRDLSELASAILFRITFLPEKAFLSFIPNFAFQIQHVINSM